MTCYIKVQCVNQRRLIGVNLTCLRTRTVRVRTRSIDVNARHNFVMHIFFLYAHEKRKPTLIHSHEKKEQSLCGQAARPAA